MITEHEQRIDELETRMEDIAARYKDKIDAAIATLDARMDKMINLSLFNAIQINRREQRDRSWAVRIHCYRNLGYKRRGPVTVQEVFETLIRPALIKALGLKQLAFLPKYQDKIHDQSKKIINQTVDIEDAISIENNKDNIDKLFVKEY